MSEEHQQPPGLGMQYNAGSRPEKSAALDLSCWAPAPASADRDIIPEKSSLEGRIIDLAQNDGLVAGAIEHHCNHTIGDGLRLNPRPNWQMLGATEEWGLLFAETLENEFAAYAESTQHHVDATGKSDWAKLQRTAYISFLLHGEILASSEWRRQAHYGTCIQILDPVRLSDPTTNTNQDIRGGVEVDSLGRPIAYHIEKRHPRDLMRFQRTTLREWQRIPAFGRNGRRRIIHIYDAGRPEQTRGVSMLATIIRRTKMGDRLTDATLQAAILQTLYALVIRSDLDWTKAMEVLGAGNTDTTGMDVLHDYISQRADYYQNLKIPIEGVRAIHLLPSESLEMTTPNNPNPDLREFLKEIHAAQARGVGMSLESFTGDYERTSFSSAQVSGQETSRGHLGRRKRVAAPFNQAVYELWLEEFLLKNPGLLPAGVSFYDPSMRGAITRAEWIGPPPMVADPVKAAEASRLRLDDLTSTLSMEASAMGMDWKQVLDQRKREQDYMASIGLENPRLAAEKMKADAAAQKANSQGGAES